jgi:hypothetical protein
MTVGQAMGLGLLKKIVGRVDDGFATWIRFERSTPTTKIGSTVPYYLNRKIKFHSSIYNIGKTT